MGIFTRFRDIVSSNLNAMLDKAEDPEKLIKMMIREMEDTLVELKASCAGVMAGCKKIQRQMAETDDQATQWEMRAALAVKHNQDELAREALLERRRYTERADKFKIELDDHNALVDQYQDDIGLLEDKMAAAREKQRLLVQRHVRAKGKIRAHKEIHRANSTEVILKFEELENRIERIEAEADLVHISKTPNLEAKFEHLVIDEDIEGQLRSLKSAFEKNNEQMHVEQKSVS